MNDTPGSALSGGGIGQTPDAGPRAGSRVATVSAADGRQPLAFVTMVRGDHLMLARWIDHHARLTESRRALHVVLHGPDDRLEALAQGCSLTVLPYDPAGTAFEPRRAKLFFGLAEALAGYYRHVVTLDADEFLVPDPALPGGLAAHLDATTYEGVALSPLGFDLIHKASVEPDPLDWTRPFTTQRRHGFLHVAYSKPCIFRARPPRGGNQHRLRHQPWQIDPMLLLVHMRFADAGYAREVSAARMQVLAQYDAAGSDHLIGAWANRDGLLRRTLAQIESEACPDLTIADRKDFATRQVQIFEERGRVLLWKGGRSDGFRLSDDWVGLV